ncbi:hypothetical protein C8R47DRAFT_1068208 [Mycena vitilis]|nr:hypothetical protein C8R47DRAFT_1068208 [Mycena vitilis]
MNSHPDSGTTAWPRSESVLANQGGRQHPRPHQMQYEVAQPHRNAQHPSPALAAGPAMGVQQNQRVAPQSPNTLQAPQQQSHHSHAFPQQQSYYPVAPQFQQPAQQCQSQFPVDTQYHSFAPPTFDPNAPPYNPAQMPTAPAPDPGMGMQQPATEPRMHRDARQSPEDPCTFLMPNERGGQTAWTWTWGPPQVSHPGTYAGVPQGGSEITHAAPPTTLPSVNTTHMTFDIEKKQIQISYKSRDPHQLIPITTYDLSEFEDRVHSFRGKECEIKFKPREHSEAYVPVQCILKRSAHADGAIEVMISVGDLPWFGRITQPIIDRLGNRQPRQLRLSFYRNGNVEPKEPDYSCRESLTGISKGDNYRLAWLDNTGRFRTFDGNFLRGYHREDPNQERSDHRVNLLFLFGLALLNLLEHFSPDRRSVRVKGKIRADRTTSSQAIIGPLHSSVHTRIRASHLLTTKTNVDQKLDVAGFGVRDKRAREAKGFRRKNKSKVAESDARRRDTNKGITHTSPAVPASDAHQRAPDEDERGSAVLGEERERNGERKKAKEGEVVRLHARYTRLLPFPRSGDQGPRCIDVQNKTGDEQTNILKSLWSCKALCAGPVSMWRRAQYIDALRGVAPAPARLRRKRHRGNDREVVGENGPCRTIYSASRSPGASRATGSWKFAIAGSGDALSQKGFNCALALTNGLEKTAGKDPALDYLQSLYHLELVLSILSILRSDAGVRSSVLVCAALVLRSSDRRLCPVAESAGVGCRREEEQSIFATEDGDFGRKESRFVVKGHGPISESQAKI